MHKEKKKPGRPRTDKYALLEACALVRMTPLEKKIFQDLAHNKGLSLSSFLRKELIDKTLNTEFFAVDDENYISPEEADLTDDEEEENDENYEE